MAYALMPVDVTLIARKMRFVVVHYHIFKNAGTTVERILDREFPGDFARLHGPTADCTLDSEDLASFLEDHPTIQAVTSHHLRYPAPSLRNVVIFDCCFLRDPLDRLDSLYNYFRRIDSTDPLCRNAHRLNAADFVRALQDAEDLEKRDQIGASLALYLKAKKLYPASDFATDGVDRLVKKIIPES